MLRIPPKLLLWRASEHEATALAFWACTISTQASSYCSVFMHFWLSLRHTQKAIKLLWHVLKLGLFWEQTWACICMCHALCSISANDGSGWGLISVFALIDVVVIGQGHGCLIPDTHWWFQVTSSGMMMAKDSVFRRERLSKSMHWMPYCPWT